jgi:hypothetical protein
MQSNAPDDGRKRRPKQIEPTWNNKFIYILHIVGYFRSCITAHGFINVKFVVKDLLLFHVYVLIIKFHMQTDVCQAIIESRLSVFCLLPSEANEITC